jgi:sarcosine oxidase
MAATYDTIVLGLGAMGGAAALHLAERGRRVLGLDRYRPPHRFGSSQGRSRAIRKAYFEHPAYVPLLERSYELWRRLEADSGRRLLQVTGALMLGPLESPVVAGSLMAATEHSLPHELLDARELRRRFPMFSPEADTVGLLEGEGGVLLPEACIEAQLELAVARGAELRFDEAATRWAPLADKDGVRVETPRGTYEAESLVVAAGAWNGPLLKGLGLPLTVVRKVMTWLRPAGGGEAFLPDRFPVWVWAPAGEEIVYGFPAMEGPDGGIKVGIHSGGAPCEPDTADSDAGPDDQEELLRCLGDRLPDIEPKPLRTCVCFYTNTPDGHFVLGAHPEHPQVILAAGFSGHGFKFAGLVGEVLTDLATAGSTTHPIGLFSPERFHR